MIAGDHRVFVKHPGTVGDRRAEQHSNDNKLQTIHVFLNYENEFRACKGHEVATSISDCSSNYFAMPVGLQLIFTTGCRVVSPARRIRPGTTFVAGNKSSWLSARVKPVVEVTRMPGWKHF